MDYVDFHVRRIADDLERAGVPIPGVVHAPAVPDEPQQETVFTTAKGHKSATYLPLWIQKHRDDPALIVKCLLSHSISEAYGLVNRALWISCTPTFAIGSLWARMWMAGCS